MSRLLWLAALTFGATLGPMQGAVAQERAPEAAQQDAAASDATVEATHQVSQLISQLISQKFGVARAKAEQISAAVMSAASKYSLPPALLLAIISVESRFKEKARGANGATGLMQVVPAAHKQLVRNIDLTEATANIEAGSAILHGYVQSARGDVGAALKSYGGSKAYAEKISLRAKAFAPQFGSGTDAGTNTETTGD
ncbi:transglycosylase SLT domain-containing protein [Caballeronia sordidicola]|uniref:Soluble lytic murein transglycosylase n=1 Tax=Caballeronia sordidicola TaxID=196367 RepID=A0A226WYB2_CABSO|nr:transglycosylase SLT domain-containing protein [Caballeronia sordidicola]OXC75859.1 Soluble lytic murein transglycosylase [Caballeronia sordidicola]